MNEKKDQLQETGQKALKDDELDQVTGGTGNECDAYVSYCAVPSCPKCSCIWLDYNRGMDGQEKYTCSKCGYTGNRGEFPYIMPPNLETDVKLR